MVDSQSALAALNEAYWSQAIRRGLPAQAGVIGRRDEAAVAIRDLISGKGLPSLSRILPDLTLSSPQPGPDF